ncbi:MAG: protein kinase [Anaerolineae bacterium]|nr:protein kinase [Anaerolineae bacterium]
MLPPGHVLQSRYTIQDHLGGGGMGSVYRAYDHRLSIEVAVKEFVPQPGLRPEEMAQLRSQFHQEATTLARLKHPGVASVSDFFEEDGRVFLVMQLVAGETLAKLVERVGPLAEAEVARLGAQLLTALDYCHQHQVLHRDIKPSNIIVLADGAPVLVDFGLVKQWDPANPTTHSLLRGMGTPHYASPEHYGFATGHTDARSDIYSVGATLYFALTGQAPPVATDRLLRPELMAPLGQTAPWLSPAIVAVIDQALALAKDTRFASAAAMRAALLGAPAYAGGAVPSSARVTTALPAPAQRRATPLWLAAVAGLALLVIIGFLAWNLLGGSRLDRPQPTDETAPAVALVEATAVVASIGATAPPPTAVAAIAAVTTDLPPTAAPAVAVIPTKTSAPPTAAPPTAVPPTAAPTDAPVVPAGGQVTAARIPAPTIDGDLSEWAGRTTYDSPFLVYWDDGWDSTNDGAVRWHLGWDDANLYIAAQITDDRHVQTQVGNQIYKGDSLEVQIDTDGGGATSVGPREFQVNLSPGDFATTSPSANLSQGTDDGGGMFDATYSYFIAVAAQRTAGGYTVEAAVPWSALLTTPGSGPMAIALNLDDNDRVGQAVQEAMYSNAPNRLFLDPSTWLPFSLTP